MGPQVIPKDRVAVTIYTEKMLIEGVAHLPKGGRLSDYINVDRRFIPISEAKLTSLVSGELIREVDVLMLNRDFVLILLPREEDEEGGEEQGNV